MSTPEIVVIVVGGIGGWLLVWLWPRRRPKSLPTFEGKAWHEVLGVSTDASAEIIEAAYRSRCQALDDLSPRIMTDTEAAADAAQRQHLDAAREKGLAQVN